LGAWLTLRKTLIFDAIAKSDGISMPQLCERFGLNRKCMNSHICQINDRLGNARLRCDRHGPGGLWYLVRER
jgi:hypothetical protein